MESGIYGIDICGITYVGSTKNFTNRFKQHLGGLQNNNHHNVILQRAFKKYGIENVKFFIIEEIPYEKKIILEREQFHIDKTKERGRCANLSGASFGDTKTGHPNRELIIEKATKTALQNMSNLTAEERKIKYGQPGTLNGMYGKTHSEEVKKFFKERIYSKDTRNKMSESAYKKFEERPELKENLSRHAAQRTGEKNPFYGKSHTKETKEKIRNKNKGLKPVNRITIQVMGEEYESYGDASKDLGIGVTTIRWRCLSENEKFKDYQIIKAPMAV